MLIKALDGALNIPFSELTKRLSEVDKSKPVYVLQETYVGKSPRYLPTEVMTHTILTADIRLIKSISQLSRPVSST